VVKNLLRVRFGTIDEELAGIIDAILNLLQEEFIPMLMHLSRQELMDRFGDEN
jgi:hypothetical protein